MFIAMLATILISIFVVTAQSGIEFNAKSKSQDGNPVLFVKIFADKTSGSVPHEVNFEPLVTNHNGNLKYYWDFGDGEISEAQNPKHTYNELGSYTCTLTVRDNKGKEKSDYIDVKVIQNNPPIVKIVVDEGGFKETVHSKTLGIRIKPPYVENLRKAVVDFDSSRYDPEFLRKEAEKYGLERFKKQMEKYVKLAVERHG